ncbi:ankyrin repeat domain-containing protein, partial [Bacillus thuringiensis]|nr:ankyrin repeat domain-containing protein [Bacillus thuringiensis]
DIHARDANGATSLFTAVEGGHTQICVMLLQCGAQVNQRKHGGWTPLHKACERNKAAIVGALLDAGADVHATQDDGISCLFS